MAFSQLDAEMNAVERLDVYATTLPQEKAREIDQDPPVGKWPTSGAISFKNLEIRYESRPDFAVIKNLSLDIQPGEKVGIVGRTGSGKSTLMTALFRIVEPTLGCMELDGVDIGKIGLKTLRKRLQIIPQEPVLFTGTIRENLDVESKFQDVEIWDVLSLVGLKEYVMKLPDKLEAAVVENGENLSVDGELAEFDSPHVLLGRPTSLFSQLADATGVANAQLLRSIAAKKAASL
ncbi:hypothetical protein BASA81_016030 [Batrachochytrium salamandrivorans]|nr:hypothetical protein BASA81_016030 [Batrachochytrium salamandrivorans]